MRTFGEEMRARLQQLHIGIRRVDDLSRRDANNQRNGALHISKYRLRELQQNPEDITVAEIAELARLCHTRFNDMLTRYLSYYPTLVGETELPSSTQLIHTQAGKWLESLASAPTETELVAKNQTRFSAASRMWPSASHYIYARIGMNDRTMWPLLSPGSLIRINTRQKVVARHGSWHNDYDRPIYFLEVRNGFACGWCDVYDRQLILTPHSLSPASPKSFTLGREVEVRGRVMGYAVDCEYASEMQDNSVHASRSETERTFGMQTHQSRKNGGAKKEDSEDKGSDRSNLPSMDSWLEESA
jgi:hypothetical protein